MRLIYQTERLHLVMLVCGRGTLLLLGFPLDLRGAAWYKFPVSDAGGCRLCADPSDFAIIPADLPPRTIR